MTPATSVLLCSQGKVALLGLSYTTSIASCRFGQWEQFEAGQIEEAKSFSSTKSKFNELYLTALESRA